MGGPWENPELHDTDTPYIHTLEGTMLASPGDWIIRGVRGEFYPCKPDIFAEAYEVADAPKASPRQVVQPIREDQNQDPSTTGGGE
jgi:hypothetical protein